MSRCIRCDEQAPDGKLLCEPCATPSMEETRVEVQVNAMVEAAVECISTLVRAICMHDRTLYRDMLERVAKRLGADG